MGLKPVDVPPNTVVPVPDVALPVVAELPAEAEAEVDPVVCGVVVDKAGVPGSFAMMLGVPKLLAAVLAPQGAKPEVEVEPNPDAAPDAAPVTPGVAVAGPGATGVPPGLMPWVCTLVPAGPGARLMLPPPIAEVPPIPVPSPELIPPAAPTPPTPPTLPAPPTPPTPPTPPAAPPTLPALPAPAAPPTPPPVAPPVCAKAEVAVAAATMTTSMPLRMENDMRSSFV
ncbi:MAG TPA: hypothetical protein VHA77_16280 [Xanthobacteraceae bacterium]|nr:hypothetical protein [Xanthobacteraceae bacterium]